MSVVMTNTAKQLHINVKIHRYNICPDKARLQTSKPLVAK